jgi:hypothetical protein
VKVRKKMRVEPRIDTDLLGRVHRGGTPKATIVIVGAEAEIPHGVEIRFFRSFFRCRGGKYLMLTPDLAISGIMSVSIITNVIYKSADFKKLWSFF